jgi:1,4-dihydroxy-2-naphthoate octaprenyltransferase
MRNDKTRALIRLARPHFLPPGFILYTLGALLASVRGFQLDLGKFLLGYSIFLFAHISTHFGNDYFDRVGDRNAEQTGLSGGSGILVSRPELAPLALRIAVGLMVLSMATAVIFTFVFSYSLWFLLFAIFAAMLAWFYTAPPLRLAYRGLSEVSTAVAVGFVMPATGYFVISGRIDAWFALFSLPFLLYGLYFILSVEMPDVDSDRASRKMTLPVKKGIGIGYSLVLVAAASSTILFFLIALFGVLGTRIDFWIVGAISLIPLAIAAQGARGRPLIRGDMIRQVKLNFTGLLLFLIAFDVLLISLVPIV